MPKSILETVITKVSEAPVVKNPVDGSLETPVPVVTADPSPTATPSTPPEPGPPVGEAKEVTPDNILSDVIGAPEAPKKVVEPAGESVSEKPRVGRPRGSRNRPRFDDLEQPSEEPPRPPPDYALMSNMTFDMTKGILVNVFGPEWQEREPAERKMVVDSLEVYLRSKKVEDIPPGLMLCVCVCAYALPRLQQQPTKSKLLVVWHWLKAKFARRKPVPLQKAA